MTTFAPRSLLYVPGSNARALEKARGLAADMLIVDLEDAVPADRKAEAREAMRAAVTAGYPGKRVAVRINGTGSPHQAADIHAVSRPAGRRRRAAQGRCGRRHRAGAGARPAGLRDDRDAEPPFTPRATSPPMHRSRG
ncbi:aldolase/citrate lyase family protein [Sphingopyxis sp. PET50]|uniref:aldolase/citrate lyase family protein n=1 Tax=Sphingopyxis sp. PET50 TaxID=2976533 RepID=UPI0021B04ECB|nr:aldolase/citrate lyase family protein [Sphingopyxis sp. PET50]